VVHGTLQLPYPSPGLWEQRLAEPPPDFYHLVAEVEGRVVGSLGLRMGRGRKAHVASLGMSVHEHFQGRGVGAALLAAALELAERWLGARRVELEVFTDNEAALRLYRRFGFEIEGTKRRYALRDGAWVDAHLMARLTPPEPAAPGDAP
jgi:putative acetyltransferase